MLNRKTVLWFVICDYLPYLPEFKVSFMKFKFGDHTTVGTAFIHVRLWME